MSPDAFVLARKDWDSDFFGREIFGLEVNDEFDPAELGSAIEDLDQHELWGTECHLPTAQFGVTPVLEELGFRLVDSRMVFVSTWTVDDIADVDVPHGRLRPVRDGDLTEIDALTVRHLVDNPMFRSRFTDRRLFTREESIRYYAAWNRLALRQDPDLFVVWDVDGAVVGYFNYMRQGEADGLPMFKGVLTAIDSDHRGHDAQNIMQSYLFARFGVERWALDNTTQITNLGVVRNHIKAGKRFQDAIITLYRLSGDAPSWGMIDGQLDN